MTPASGAQLRIRPAERRLLQGALLLAAALLLYGSVAPLMTLQKFYLFENEVSLLSGLRQLVEQGRWLLVLIIGGSVLLGLLLDSVLGTKPAFIFILLLASIPVTLWVIYRYSVYQSKRIMSSQKEDNIP